MGKRGKPRGGRPGEDPEARSPQEAAERASGGGGPAAGGVSPPVPPSVSPAERDGVSEPDSGGGDGGDSGYGVDPEATARLRIVPASPEPAGPSPDAARPGGRAAARGRAGRSGRGGRSRRSGRAGRRRPRRASLLRELPVLVVVAVVLALLIKTFFVQAFFIPSGSMQQTIGIGDRVLVDKLTPWFGAKPERGEIVVFRDPGGWLARKPKHDPPPVIKQLKQAMVYVGLLPSDDDQDLIKRVIGVGGDTVACCDPSGRVTVNGVPLDEPYIYPGDAPSNLPFSVTVPKGRLWVMGDHRGDSSDSRAHQDRPYQGTISEDDVVGRAFTVAWPISRWRGLPVPATFKDAGKFTQTGAASAVLPRAPVVMGLAGAVPVILLRRRVRSRPRSRDIQARRPGTRPVPTLEA